MADGVDDADRVNLVAEVLQVVPRLITRTRHQAEVVATLAGLLPCRGTTTPGDAPPAEPHESVGIDVLTLLESEPAAEVDDPSAAPLAAPAEADLPLQDYDSLAASQVVPRLATMSEAELLAVQAYEQAHRRRQTILNRIAQRLSA